jgi:hypothetical protein
MCVSKEAKILQHKNTAWPFGQKSGLHLCLEEDRHKEDN